MTSVFNRCCHVSLPLKVSCKATRLVTEIATSLLPGPIQTLDFLSVSKVVVARTWPVTLSQVLNSRLKSVPRDCWHSVKSRASSWFNQAFTTALEAGMGGLTGSHVRASQSWREPFWFWVSSRFALATSKTAIGASGHGEHERVSGVKSHTRTVPSLLAVSTRRLSALKLTP